VAAKRPIRATRRTTDNTSNFARAKAIATGRKEGGRLTASERHELPEKDFALPGRRYPVENASHARNALARISANGTSEEKAEVRKAVHRKYPGIGES